MTEADMIETALRESPITAPLLDRWGDINLPDAWLVAGAVAQTVWNARHGLPVAHGMKDVDIVYHDAADLSESGEAEQAARIGTMFADLPVRLDVKNEARVHLWYEARFGYPIAPYASARAAIATFPTTATSVGVRPGINGLEIEAPFGLSDLCNGRIRPNKVQITAEIYRDKVDRWHALWPALKIETW
ncbi:MAG: nucleotidyltransferase family protein [Pikeienuella sp.]